MGRQRGVMDLDQNPSPGTPEAAPQTGKSSGIEKIRGIYGYGIGQHHY